MQRTIWIAPVALVTLVLVLFWWKDASEPAEISASPPVQPTVDRLPAPKLALEKTSPPRSDEMSNSELSSLGASEDLTSDDDFHEEEDPVAESRRIRLPVILAIRGKHENPAARRRAMLEALENSGESAEPWTHAASDVFARWDHVLASELQREVQWQNTRCFRAGCEVPVLFPSRESYEQAAQAFRSLREEDTTHGGRVQTPAVERDDGRVEASWVMMRPDGETS